MQMIMMKKMLEDKDEKRKEEEKVPMEKIKWRGVKLDIKYFSRVTAFSGDHSKFRDWFFGVNTVIGTIDQKLCGALKKLLEEDNILKAEDQPPKEDYGVSSGVAGRIHDGAIWIMDAAYRGRCERNVFGL